MDILNGKESKEKKKLLDKIAFILLRRNSDKLYKLRKDGDIGKEGKYEMVVTEGAENSYDGKQMENYAGEVVINNKTVYYDLEMRVNNLSEKTLALLREKSASISTDENLDELDEIEEMEEVRSNLLKKAFKFKQRIFYLLEHKIENDVLSLYYATMGLSDKYTKYTTDTNEHYINAVGKAKKTIQYTKGIYSHQPNKEDTFIIVNNADKYMQQVSVMHKGTLIEDTEEDKKATQALKLELLCIDNQLVVKEKKY